MLDIHDETSDHVKIFILLIPTKMSRNQIYCKVVIIKKYKGLSELVQ